MDRKHEILNQFFGYTVFRGGQEELIDAQLAGRDVLGVMPTGGGKSLCYQIPAILMKGITIVISPLISLMKDQVMSLKNVGLPAAYINSSLTDDQIKLVYRNILGGKYKIVYVAPERLLTKEFISVIQNIEVSLLAVDEAHCISQWGQDFRPSYLRIVEFLKLIGYRPVVSAFTATATSQVREDIEHILNLKNPLRVITGFDRPNLHYEVQKPKNKSAALYKLIMERKGKSGIIYCTTRKDVENICEMLQSAGIGTTRYHAGLPEDERRANQDDFIYDRSNVMVATNAFGMGIDKSNVSFVIHYNMPQSIEAYYQEAGRAGRDGTSADCILLYSPKDIHTAKYLIEHPTENEELTDEERQNVIKQELERLNKMIGYCTTNHCLRGYILGYFGQKHQRACGNCGNCNAMFEEKDITTQAKMILSCVQRISDRLGYSLGITNVARVLYGSKDKHILALQLDTISTYGLMHGTSQSEIKDLIESLKSQGYLISDFKHGALSLTKKANEVLFRNKSVNIYVLKESNAGEKAMAAPQANENLFSALKDLRTRIAREENVPAYIVFPNSTLRDMAEKSPITIEDLLSVPGIGKYKAQRYGKLFLEEIKRHIKDENHES